MLFACSTASRRITRTCRWASSSTPARLEFRLVTASDRVLARETAVIGPSTRDGQTVELGGSEALRAQAAQASSANASSHEHEHENEKIYLEVRNEHGATSRFPTAFEVASRT